jgi:hypothetical protein
MFVGLGLIAGGNWADGAICGSQARNGNNSRLHVNVNHAGRGYGESCKMFPARKGEQGIRATPAERQGRVGSIPAKHIAEGRRG